MQIMKFCKWKKENKGQVTPLLSFMVMINNLMWTVATIGAAAVVLFQLIPWSIGWVERIDILLSRTLFWYFGHALVYFWLLPAYMVWYVAIPKIIGGKIFSDALARLAFILFLLLSRSSRYSSPINRARYRCILEIHSSYVNVLRCYSKSTAA